MAKRKAAPRRSSGQAKAKGRKSAGRKAAAKTSRARVRRPAVRKASGRKAPTRKASARKPPSRKAATRKATVRKAAARTAAARNATARKATPRKAPARKAPAPQAPAPRAARKTTAPKTLVTRKAPALNRARRTVQDDDLVPSPPSSLDLDRSASSARSGRRELSERYREHTEASPAITGGDVDADWESAYAVGDEAPGGDNPTPDQDIVDDIGKALGVQYEDNEELKGEKKISDRDKHRWELDPASAEDYPDHDEE